MIYNLLIQFRHSYAENENLPYKELRTILQDKLLNLFFFSKKKLILMIKSLRTLNNDACNIRLHAYKNKRCIFIYV